MTITTMGLHSLLFPFIYLPIIVTSNNVRTTSGVDCVFPYVYQNNKYYSCISANHDRPWCAISNNYDSDGRWSNCISEEIEVFGGRGNRNTCSFPFRYRGRDRYECITEAHNTSWCGTTRDVDVDGLWGNCANTPMWTTEGNSYGAPCCFPYVYMGMEFAGCNSFDTRFNKAWCATTPNYDSDKQWGYCRVKTYGGEKSNGADCVFPYLFGGKEYGRCQVSPGLGRFEPWCSTTYNYNSDRAWGYCIMKSNIRCVPSGSVTQLPGQTTTVLPNATTTISGTARNSCTYRKFEDTNAKGGLASSGAQSQEECVRQCDDAFTCVGLDYDMNDGARPRCWHHFDVNNFRQDNVGVAIGVDQFRKIACSRQQVTTCEFTQRNNTNSFGATALPGATTPDQCRSSCIQDQSCLAYEWESNPNPNNRLQCFIHKNSANLETTYTSPDKTTTQFRKISATC